ncbi:MAG: NAD(P)-binding domain-containing protein, partial [Rhodothermales bacterium]
MNELVLLWLVAILLIAGILVPYVVRHRRKEQKAIETLEQAMAAGVGEPETLHPVVNPSICIGTGDCVLVCPEKDVLAVISGRAVPVNQTHCVGHGLCERSCPVEAIQLVVGTSRRGVDIPRIRENFETNVPGIYVVGELGGMGLIRNAFEQARQCVAGIAQETRRVQTDVLDVLVVGCGPAGFATSLNCIEKNLRFVTIEKEDIGGAVRHYPRKKLVMSSPLVVPGYGKVNHRQIVKEDLVSLWEDIMKVTGVSDHIQTKESFEAADSQGDFFEVRTSTGTYRTARIVLAIGRRGIPRKLGIPGENDGANVSYSLLEPERFQGDRIVVVGGGDSAIEAALSLAEQPENTVRLSYRKDRFSRLKPDNQSRIERAVNQGDILFLPSTNLTGIEPTRVTYSDASGSTH